MSYFQQVADLQHTNVLKGCVVVNGVYQSARGLWAGNEKIEIPSQAPKQFWDSCWQKLKSLQNSRLLQVQEQKVFAELYEGRAHLVICGGGHIPLSLVEFAHKLEFAVTLIDDRPDMATKDRFPLADQLFSEDYTEALRQIPDRENTYYVIVTRDPVYDQVCLSEIYRRKYAYIGLLGSKRRITKVRQGLEQDGIGAGFFASIAAPIGLNIGAQTPEEISIAIMAQLVAAKNRRPNSFGLSQELLRGILAQSEAALATIVDVRGTVPRQTGTKMLVLPDGKCLFTVGGGRMEEEVRLAGVQCIRQKRSRLLRLDMNGNDIGPYESFDDHEAPYTGVHGIVEVFLEPVINE